MLRPRKWKPNFKPATFKHVLSIWTGCWFITCQPVWCQWPGFHNHVRKLMEIEKVLICLTMRFPARESLIAWWSCMCAKALIRTVTDLSLPRFSSPCDWLLRANTALIGCTPTPPTRRRSCEIAQSRRSHTNVMPHPPPPHSTPHPFACPPLNPSLCIKFVKRTIAVCFP